MQTITVNEALLSLEALNVVYQRLTPAQRFEVDKVKAALNATIEMVQPHLTGDQQKDQWIVTARTLPFSPLVFNEVFCNVKRLKPHHFRALKWLCETEVKQTTVPA